MGTSAKGTQPWKQRQSFRPGLIRKNRDIRTYRMMHKNYFIAYTLQRKDPCKITIMLYDQFCNIFILHKTNIIIEMNQVLICIIDLLFHFIFNIHYLNEWIWVSNILRDVMMDCLFMTPFSVCEDIMITERCCFQTKRR